MRVLDITILKTPLHSINQDSGDAKLLESPIRGFLFSSSFVICTSLLSTLLISCGGGGESSEPHPNNPDPQSYTLSGTLSGLISGETVVLQNNGNDSASLTANGTFSFSNTIAPNTAYLVIVRSQPLGQNCTVNNGSGATGNGVGTKSISNISVACSSTIAPTTLSSEYSTTVWQDNFAGYSNTQPNSNIWASITGNGREYGIPGWGNNEAEYYLPLNASVGNGVLSILGKADNSVSEQRCANDQSPCKFSSAKLTSLKTIDMSTPGFLEIKASVPVTIGSWPALWLLPAPAPSGNFPPSTSELTNQTRWPEGGEIDLLEYMWAYANGNPNQTQISMHLPQVLSQNNYSDHYEYTRDYLSNSASNMHLYQLLWSENQIQYAIDNTVVMTCIKTLLSCSNLDPTSPTTFPIGSSWPYGSSYKNYYLVMNLAIGGAGITGANNALIPANYNQTMQVAHVRYMTP